MNDPILRNHDTGKIYTRADINRMRSELEAWTGLDLSDMSEKSVIVNHALNPNTDNSPSAKRARDDRA